MQRNQLKHYWTKSNNNPLRLYSDICKRRKYGCSNITLASLNIGKFISFLNNRKTQRNVTLHYKYNREILELYLNYGRVCPPIIKLSAHCAAISDQGRRNCTIKRKSIMGGNHEINDRSWKP